MTSGRSPQVRRYLELASPQLLDERWRELSFDLASGQSGLQDCVVPESGSGYVYRDSKIVGSATHNRFLYWRTINDVLELTELSTEVNLEDNQVRIRFVNSPIVDNINVIEFPESIAIVLATMTSIHRIFLPHPKTTSRSVLSNLTSDVLFDPANFHLLNGHSSESNQPLSASSWFDKTMVKCAVSFPDSSILIIQFGYQSHQVTTSEIKQTGIIGRLWSKMPNLWAKCPGECENTIFASVPFFHQETNDFLLITLCRDCRIRIFSTTSKECVCSFNMVPQSSFHQSFAAHANPSSETPMIRLLGSYIVIYLCENRPEFIFMQHSYADNTHELKECVTLQTPEWDKLLDFGVTKDKIWALANTNETESQLWYMDHQSVVDRANDENSLVEGLWEFVHHPELIETPSPKNLAAEIFWRNHFSVSTVQKALIGIAGPSIPKKNSMESLEELASTRIVNENQEVAWRRFHEYCIQNHLTANKCVGLILSEDESVISIIKRSNPSFVCPWLVNLDVALQEGPYRGVEFSQSSRLLIDSLNKISSELLNDDYSNFLEEKFYESPMDILSAVDTVVKSLITTDKNCLRLNNFNPTTYVAALDHICDELDLSDKAKKFNSFILEDYATKMRSEHNPLSSSSGIIITFELFRRFVRARMLLARDVLFYIRFLREYAEVDKSLGDFVEELHQTSRIKRLCDSLRCYVALAWLTESPIKTSSTPTSYEVIDFVSKNFEFFKQARRVNNEHDSLLQRVLQQNVLMKFLSEGGVHFHWSLNQMTSNHQTLSNSYYITETAYNLCLLLWPLSTHLCIEEFFLTNQLDDQLSKYLHLLSDWTDCCQTDRQFISACSYMLQNRAIQSVDIFNRLWPDATSSKLLRRFLDFDFKPQCGTSDCGINTSLINRYYSKLIHLFQIYNNRHCLVMIINHCMSLIKEDAEQSQVMNSLRAKLFQYHLELEDPDEAYHTMVSTTDPSLRINCLRKFIVNHCERGQWINLLSYPYIDIKHEFINILTEKAESLDLSRLDAKNYYNTSYYDLLFASYVMDNEFRCAAEVMYNHSQRLALEVPGLISIKKQADCLLIALNSLKSVDDKERFIELNQPLSNCNGRASVNKRSYDSDSNHSSAMSQADSEINNQSFGEIRIDVRDLEKKYELTKARMKLLEKDAKMNAIALSPLKPEETINQLVSSSMFSAAMDLALLFQTPMEPILDGLTSKYILVMRLSTVDLAVYQNIERDLSDLFTNSYSNIDTYNYVANSTSSLVGRLWRLIDYYLSHHDGVDHRCRACDNNESLPPTTVLMRVVATKLLAAGYDVPASLSRMYKIRKPAELLKLLMKYDRLIEACSLASEMIDRILEPSGCIPMLTSKSDRPPPVYLPTHLILMLISFLEEDATDTAKLKLAGNIREKLDKFRQYVKSN